MRFELALLAITLSLSACAARDTPSAEVNPTPPDEARSIPPSATPPTLPENPDKEAMPPGPVNPR